MATVRRVTLVCKQEHAGSHKMELNSLPIVSQSSVATWFLIKRNKKCCDRFFTLAA